MSELSEKHFGLLIAYVLPGFVTLWGISSFSPTVETWISTDGVGAPTVAGFMYVTLASIGAGLTVSAIRWAMIDSLHHATGIEPPRWDFEKLDERLEGFTGLVENHYRYYQFYGNMFIAVAIAYRARLIWAGISVWEGGLLSVGFFVLEAILLAGSRDALRKYYSRAARLLRNRLGGEKGELVMTNGYGHKKKKVHEKVAAKSPRVVERSPKDEKRPKESN